jgi:hypothetical protein
LTTAQKEKDQCPTKEAPVFSEFLLERGWKELLNPLHLLQRAVLVLLLRVGRMILRLTRPSMHPLRSSAHHRKRRGHDPAFF